MFGNRSSNSTVLLLICFCFWKENLSENVETLTSYQKDALKVFRPIAVKVSDQDFMKTDAYLVRWLQAHNFDVVTTLEKFHKNQQWRKKHKIGNILGEEFPIFIQNDFPLTISTYDKQGRPVAITPAGKFNMRRMALKGQADIMHRFGTMLFELLEVHMYELQCNGTLDKNIMPQITVIIDLASISPLNSACFNCLANIPKFIDVYDSNYPDLVRRAFLINVPRVMETVLTTLVSFLSSKAKEAVHVYGHDKTEWSEALLQEIPFDQLSVSYGGGGGSALRNSKQDKSVWNWNNPALETVFQEFRHINTSNFRNCLPKPEPTEIELELDNTNWNLDHVNIDISTETPAAHRHRHHHGQPLVNSVEANLASKPEISSQATSITSEDDDRFFINNDWIDEIDSSEDYSLNSDLESNDSHGTIGSDYQSSENQENYSENIISSSLGSGGQAHAMQKLQPSSFLFVITVSWLLF